MSKDKDELLDDEEWDFTDDEPEEGEEDESTNLPVAVEVDEVQLPAAWAFTSSQVDEVRKSRKMFNLKHGYLANVPMVCKNDKCPLKDVCTVHPSNRPTGQRCPIEIAAIIDGYDKACKELGIQEDDYFDQSQVKDLIDVEVKLMRTRGVLASVDHFVEMVTIGVDSAGNKLQAPQLHKATEYEDKLLARKAKILSDLNSTRKQREKNQSTNDPSSFASDLMQRAMKARMRMGMVVDVDADDVTDVTDDSNRIDVTPSEGE